jgi:hypothetical protein
MSAPPGHLWPNQGARHLNLTSASKKCLTGLIRLIRLKKTVSFVSICLFASCKLVVVPAGEAPVAGHAHCPGE